MSKIKHDLAGWIEADVIAEHILEELEEQGIQPTLDNAKTIWLDVLENEPEMAAGLADLDNVILAPHIGSGSHGTRDRMAIMCAENALAHLKGEKAPNCVNPEVYETAAYRRRAVPRT